MKRRKAKLLMSLAILVTLVMVSGCFSLLTMTETQQNRYSTVTFDNNTGVTIWYLYISPRTNSNWGSDWLGDNVIRNGESYAVKVVYGEYDVKLEDSNRNTYTAWIRVNSNSHRFVFTPEDRD